MKVTVEELLIAANALASLSGQKMPLRASSWIVLLNKKLKPSVTLITEKRNEIIRKFAPEGKNSVPKERMDEYNAALKPFLEDEIEIDPGQKMKKEIFEQVLIAPQDLLALDLFLED